MDLDFATATEITTAIAGRSVSSREVLEHLIARVDRIDGDLNAIVALDLDRARAAADSADTVTASGAPTGPLHGLPMTVKDVWETEGLVTTSGAPELASYVPAADALAVGRLRNAGAIIFGKTNTPLYAGDFQTYNDVYGLTSNPWDTARTAGGSSGGRSRGGGRRAYAARAGERYRWLDPQPCPLQRGVRDEAVVGGGPQPGPHPGPPGTLVESDVNCNGPLARSLEDLVLALDVVAGPLPEDAPGWRLVLDDGPAVDDISALRVATVFHEGTDVLPLTSDLQAGLEGYAARLADAGARVEAIALPVPLAEGLHSWQELVLPIIGLGLPDDAFDSFAGLEAVPGDDPMLVAGRALAGRYRTWARANGRRQHQRAAWAACFERYDVVLAPVMPTTAFPHDVDRPLPERFIDVDGTAVSHLVAMAWCGAVGSVLLPVVTLPTGPTPDGLPVGVQVVGPFLGDRRLLRIADLLETAAGPGFIPPPL